MDHHWERTRRTVGDAEGTVVGCVEVDAAGAGAEGYGEEVVDAREGGHVW